ncbi:hypothetical protein Dsin_027864 [Dipteronia sinensis]|uniref:SWIM-type domain-containing protein n=1 Tax=Dipteronia sinensis TaxID=43782 RepID=A0AAE0DTP7_9ROSI|nr:hypothetical protein Dsin_027864 [Dipteronia sinensis]
MLTIISAGEMEYEVLGPDGSYAVKLRQYSCSCGSWQGMIHPIPQQKMWPEMEMEKLLPPHFQTQPGRPKLQRKREPDEKAKGGRSETVVCTSCQKPGHNKRTCKCPNFSPRRTRSQTSLNHQLQPPLLSNQPRLNLDLS